MRSPRWPSQASFAIHDHQTISVYNDRKNQEASSSVAGERIAPPYQDKAKSRFTGFVPNACQKYSARCTAHADIRAYTCAGVTIHRTSTISVGALRSQQPAARYGVPVDILLFLRHILPCRQCRVYFNLHDPSPLSARGLLYPRDHFSRRIMILTLQFPSCLIRRNGNLRPWLQTSTPHPKPVGLRRPPSLPRI